MQQKVDVTFGINPKPYSFAGEGNFNKGDYVIVESSLGTSFARVENVFDLPVGVELKKIVRVATPNDIKQNEQNKERERTAVRVAKSLVAELDLDMDIVNAEYAFDGSKVLISFVSENRVDFRDLVKSLATKLHSRIELKQIGIRDEARLVGGIGICGRVCCCASHLKDFEKVSIKMAKVQGLALNPSKISGACGRLMCCLEYENPYYAEVSAVMPKINSEVKTKDGKGVVVYQNLLKQLVSVKFEPGDGSSIVREYPLKEVSKVHFEQKNFASDSTQNKQFGEKSVTNVECALQKEQKNVSASKRKHNHNKKQKANGEDFLGEVKK